MPGTTNPRRMSRLKGREGRYPLLAARLEIPRLATEETRYKRQHGVPLHFPRMKDEPENPYFVVPEFREWELV